MRLAAWTPPIAEAATFYAPWELGYFAQAGEELEWLAADGSPAALALLGTPRQESRPSAVHSVAEAAFVSCLAFLQAAAGGEPVLAVYNLFPRSCFAVFGPAATGVRRPRDLVGRRLGVRSLHSSGFAWPRLLLRLDGLSGDEFEPVVVGEAGVARLLAGEVDGLVGSDAVLWDARRAGLEEVYVFWLEAALPLPSDVIAVRAERLAELAPRLAAFLGAYQRGRRFAETHPDEAARAIAARAVDGQDPERNRAMLELRLKLSEPRPGQRPGWFDLAALQASADTLARHSLLPGRVEVARCFTNEVVARLGGAPGL